MLRDGFIPSIKSPESTEGDVMRTTIAFVNAATAAVLLVLGGAAAAQAGPGSLQGRYGLSASGTCLGSPTGFYPNNVAIEPSSVRHDAVGRYPVRAAHGTTTTTPKGEARKTFMSTCLSGK